MKKLLISSILLLLALTSFQATAAPDIQTEDTQIGIDYLLVPSIEDSGVNVAFVSGEVDQDGAIGLIDTFDGLTIAHAGGGHDPGDFCPAVVSHSQPLTETANNRHFDTDRAVKRKPAFNALYASLVTDLQDKVPK